MTGPWYQLRPRVALGAAVVLFALVTTFHWFDDGSGQAIVVLYVLPVALVAVATGLRGGIASAAVGFGLFSVLEVVHSSGDIDGTGWAVRAVALFLLGGLLGHATDRTRSSQQAALAEQERRSQVEEKNRRFAEAMEISDSLVQKMVAAKWMAEQGRSEETAEALAATIAEGERMVAGLLQQRMIAPCPGDVDRAVGQPPRDEAPTGASRRRAPRRSRPTSWRAGRQPRTGSRRSEARRSRVDCIEVTTSS